MTVNATLAHSHPSACVSEMSWLFVDVVVRCDRCPATYLHRTSVSSMHPDAHTAAMAAGFVAAICAGWSCTDLADLCPRESAVTQ